MAASNGSNNGDNNSDMDDELSPELSAQLGDLILGAHQFNVDNPNDTRGKVENAQHDLGHTITVQPDSVFSKYLTSGQLFTGTSSIDLYLSLCWLPPPPPLTVSQVMSGAS